MPMTNEEGWEVYKVIIERMNYLEQLEDSCGYMAITKQIALEAEDRFNKCLENFCDTHVPPKIWG
jgi:hypothetical protein